MGGGQKAVWRGQNAKICMKNTFFSDAWVAFPPPCHPLPPSASYGPGWPTLCKYMHLHTWTDNVPANDEGTSGIGAKEKFSFMLASEVNVYSVGVSSLNTLKENTSCRLAHGLHRTIHFVGADDVLFHDWHSSRKLLRKKTAWWIQPDANITPQCNTQLDGVTCMNNVAHSGCLQISAMTTSPHRVIFPWIELFEKNSENAFFPEMSKMVEMKKQWYHQKVLHEDFPMNGHVSRFWQS
jgi:hypothetical protein